MGGRCSGNTSRLSDGTLNVGRSTYRSKKMDIEAGLAIGLGNGGSKD